MVVLSVLYPATAGARFDQAYYDATHAPLVLDAFGSTGLTDLKVFKGLSAVDGGPAPFVLMAHLTFESPEALAASMGGPRAPEVLGDVANFTDIAPVIQVSALG